MPKRFLTPLTTGSTMRSLSQAPMDAIFSSIPFISPSTTRTPTSAISSQLISLSFADIVSPISSPHLVSRPLQSIFSSRVTIDCPISFQSKVRISSSAKSRAAFSPSLMVRPASAQSTERKNSLIFSAIPRAISWIWGVTVSRNPRTAWIAAPIAAAMISASAPSAPTQSIPIRKLPTSAPIWYQLIPAMISRRKATARIKTLPSVCPKPCQSIRPKELLTAV